MPLPPEIIGVTANKVRTARVAAAKAKLRRRERLEIGIDQEPCAITDSPVDRPGHADLL